MLESERCGTSANSLDVESKWADGDPISGMGSTLVQRRASLSDAEEISAILAAAFAQFRSLYTDGGFAATTPSAETVQLRLAAGPAWLAVLDNRAVGTVSVVVRGERLYVRGMAVLPSLRGLGVGAALLREVENFAAEQQVKSLYLSTTPFLHSAIRLYEAWGFTPTDEGPHDLFGTPLFTMEKSLRS